MEMILQQIRGVPGVSGVMILDRLARRTWKLLPSSFDDAAVEELEQRVEDLTKRLQGEHSFTIRFSSGWLVTKVADDFVLQVLAKENLGMETLDLVLKASLSSLRRSRSTQAEPAGTDEFDPNTAYLLLEAVNCTGRYFLRTIGAFRASSLLRKAKDHLLSAFPMLKHFPVDNNCNVSLIRGSEKHLDHTIVDAMACLCYYFKETVNAQTPVVGFDIRSVTSGSEEELTAIGFYSSYQRAASKVMQLK